MKRIDLREKSTNAELAITKLEKTKNQIIREFSLILVLLIIVTTTVMILNDLVLKNEVKLFGGTLAARDSAHRMNAKVMSAYLGMREIVLADTYVKDNVDSRLKEVNEDISQANELWVSLHTGKANIEGLSETLDILKKQIDDWAIINENTIRFVRDDNLAAARKNVYEVGTPHVKAIQVNLNKIVELASTQSIKDFNNLTSFNKATIYVAITMSCIIILVCIAVLVRTIRQSNLSISLITSANEELFSTLEQLAAAQESLSENIAVIEEEQQALLESEAKLQKIAYYDTLTGLPNRALFVKKLQAFLEKSKTDGSSGAIMFVDIDNFKTINDLHGHVSGDKFLCKFSKKISSISENSFVARFGGDEFLVFIEKFDGLDSLTAIVQNFITNLQHPITIEESTYNVTASIGVAVTPHDGTDVDTLLKHADTAMYYCKKASKNGYAFFNSQILASVKRKKAVTEALQNAIKNGNVYMVFQPQVSTKTKQIESFEALMRLKDNDSNFISPAEFIPVSEETGDIISLGYWAINHVIECDIRLRKLGLEYGSISVNISERQFREHNFVAMVAEIIKKHNFDASRLHFEITESLLIEDIEKKSEILDQLQKMGIRIELDDFGTGYSSLSYLRTLPIDILKIDRKFILGIGEHPRDELLIDVILQLAKLFNMKTVAEGVETQEQLEYLQDKGADTIQGYFYSQPVHEKDLENLFRDFLKK